VQRASVQSRIRAKATTSARGPTSLTPAPTPASGRYTHITAGGGLLFGTGPFI